MDRPTEEEMRREEAIIDSLTEEEKQRRLVEVRNIVCGARRRVRRDLSLRRSSYGQTVRYARGVDSNALHGKVRQEEAGEGQEPRVKVEEGEVTAKKEEAEEAANELEGGLEEERHLAAAATVFGLPHSPQVAASHPPQHQQLPPPPMMQNAYGYIPAQPHDPLLHAAPPGPPMQAHYGPPPAQTSQHPLGGPVAQGLMQDPGYLYLSQGAARMLLHRRSTGPSWEEQDEIFHQLCQGRQWVRAEIRDAAAALQEAEDELVSGERRGRSRRG